MDTCDPVQISDLPKANPQNKEVAKFPAAPGANQKEHPKGPVDDNDRLFIAAVRRAGMWERPACEQAMKKSKCPQLLKIAKQIAADHQELDRITREVAGELNEVVPDTLTPQQTEWMMELACHKGADFDATYAMRLRQAHGAVFSSIATVRANTKNSVMRKFAQSANFFVSRHMALLESTGLIRHELLPFAEVGGKNSTLKAGGAVV
ncbi:hypothetical protein HK104_003243 [Borealophlyctis nickersoniae]|nr:hypothetical protein HK104_003243 [Borealophlyctis nickersoniae]